MAGIYVHVPFCKSKCGYCDFYSIVPHKGSTFVSKYVDSIVQEINFKSYLFKNQIINTIYFGGGTPSILDVDYIKRIYNEIVSCFKLSGDVECTLEINPEHATDEYFKKLKELGFVNRLSAGLQSMSDDCLKYLGRRHTVSDNYRYIELCKRYDFNNYSVDYIFNYELITIDDVKSSLKYFAENNVPHISAYSLTIEDKTPFMLRLKKGIIHLPDDDNFVEQFNLIDNLLTKYGYQHYEISNYCLPNCHSRHNSNYWKSEYYLGFGPSAYSYYNFDNKDVRSNNAPNLNEYFNQINLQKLDVDREVLTFRDKYNEYVMVKLRTSEGVDINYVKLNFPKYYDNFLQVVNNYSKYFEVEDNFARLNMRGWAISDGIISDLFM